MATRLAMSVRDEGGEVQDELGLDPFGRDGPKDDLSSTDLSIRTDTFCTARVWPDQRVNRSMTRLPPC